MYMPMSVDEKALFKTYMSRKIRTIPLLILMLFSLFPLGMFSFQWVCGQLSWHKTEAEVVMVNADGGGFYRYKISKTGEVLSGTYQPRKILVHYQIDKNAEVGDKIKIAYNPNKPSERVLFADLELKMLTWLIVFLFCFITYFWMEWVLKKRAKIKIAG